MKYEGVRFISNGAIKKAVVSKEADFGARREAFMNVVNVDIRKERGPRGQCPGGLQRGRGKCAVNKDPLSMALYCRKDADQLRRLPQMP